MTQVADASIRTTDGPILKADDLGHRYGSRQVLQGLDFEVNRGELMCIVGPSGVGKTTLLECLTGLRRPTDGAVLFDGKRIENPPRGLAIVFQDYSRSLMPWLSVLDNVTLPLRSAGVAKDERKKVAMEALTEVGLADFTDSYPWQLSGGMQQRVAIARALAYRPDAIVMDEPFASVDAQTRADLEDLLLRVREHLGVTIILVTHDIDEAVYLSDRVLALGGRPADGTAGGKAAGIRELLEIDLPSPREQVTTKGLPRFAELRSHVYRLIRNV